VSLLEKLAFWGMEFPGGGGSSTNRLLQNMGVRKERAYKRRLHSILKKEGGKSGKKKWRKRSEREAGRRVKGSRATTSKLPRFGRRMKKLRLGRGSPMGGRGLRNPKREVLRQGRNHQGTRTKKKAGEQL